MSQFPDDSRRRLLKFLGAAPLLPLAGYASATSMLSACGGGDDDTPAATVTSVSFTGMAALDLSNAAAMATTSVGSSLVASYSDGSQRTFALKYEPFFVTGDMVPDGKGGTLLAGGYVDIHNQPIIDRS